MKGRKIDCVHFLPFLLLLHTGYRIFIEFEIYVDKFYVLQYDICRNHFDFNEMQLTSDYYVQKIFMSTLISSKLLYKYFHITFVNKKDRHLDRNNSQTFAGFFSVTLKK
ncbi:hypothetical protein ACKWTF_004800 [Chironomus riparius]